MKLWVDDVRTAPNDYVWCKTVNQTIEQIKECMYMYRHSRKNEFWKIELIDLDHDAGQYASDGGDYIAVLDFLVQHKDIICEMGTVFRIHSMNVVGRQNMQRIIERNGWKLIR